MHSQKLYFFNWENWVQSLGLVHIYLGLNLDPGPGAMGNHHQRGDGEFPHEPVDKDWSVLGPCC